MGARERYVRWFETRTAREWIADGAIAIAGSIGTTVAIFAAKNDVSAVLIIGGALAVGAVLYWVILLPERRKRRREDKVTPS